MSKTYSEKLKDPRWQKKPGIYKLKIANEYYVGSAVNLCRRLRSHLNDLICNRHINKKIQNRFNKYAEIDFEVLEIISNVDELISREQYYIDTLIPSLNIAKIAGSQLGMRHSEETKAKISVLQSGRKIPKDIRERMSAGHIGKKLTEDHRKNLSISKKGEKNPFFRAGKNHPQYGIKRRQSTIEKISGDISTHSKSGVLYDIETGANHIFFSLKPICKKLNLEYRGVLSAQRGKRFYKDRYYIDFVDTIPRKVEVPNG